MKHLLSCSLQTLLWYNGDTFSKAFSIHPLEGMYIHPDTHIDHHRPVDPPGEAGSGVTVDLDHELGWFALLRLHGLRHEVKHGGTRLLVLLRPRGAASLPGHTGSEVKGGWPKLWNFLDGVCLKLVKTWLILLLFYYIFNYLYFKTIFF